MNEPLTAMFCGTCAAAQDDCHCGNWKPLELPLVQPHVCPKCGGDTWVAEYTATVRQPIRLCIIGGEVTPDYIEPAEIIEESGDDETWRCRDCDFTYFNGQPEDADA